MDPGPEMPTMRRALPVNARTPKQPPVMLCPFIWRTEFAWSSTPNGAPVAARQSSAVLGFGQTRSTSRTPTLKLGTVWPHVVMETEACATPARRTTLEIRMRGMGPPSRREAYAIDGANVTRKMATARNAGYTSAVLHVADLPTPALLLDAAA